MGEGHLLLWAGAGEALGRLPGGAPAPWGKIAVPPTGRRARDAGKGHDQSIDRLVLQAPEPVPGQLPEICPARTTHSPHGASQRWSARVQGVPTLFRLRQAERLLRPPIPLLTCSALALGRSLEVICGSWAERSPSRESPLRAALPEPPLKPPRALPFLSPRVESEQRALGVRGAQLRIRPLRDLGRAVPFSVHPPRVCRRGLWWSLLPRERAQPGR